MARKKDKPTPAPEVLDAVKVEAERQEMPKMEASAETTAPSGLVKEAPAPELKDELEAATVEASAKPMPKLNGEAKTASGNLASPSAPAPVTELQDTIEAIEIEAARKPMPRPHGEAVASNPGGMAAPSKTAAPATAEAPVPELYDTIDAAKVEESMPTMPELKADAAPQSQSGLSGERPEHSAPAAAPEQPVGFRPMAGKSFAQQAIQWRDDYDARLAEERKQIEQDKKAAQYTGFAELGSALANLIGVAEGNAVSQTHKTFSQDWMKKADQDMRDHRKRIDDLRARQKDIELRREQLKQNQLRDLLNEQHQRRQDELARQKAILDAKLKEGEMNLNEYKAETERLKAASTAAYNDARTAIQRSNSAQGWAKINASQDKHTNAMIQKGWVPDPKAEGGFRYDPAEAKRRYGVDIAGADTSTAAATQPTTPAIKQGFAWNPQGAQEQKPGWSLGGEAPQQEKKEGQQNAAGNKKKSKLDNYQ